MAATQYHEAADTLRADTREMHRALGSLIEEFDAVDWYAQRIDASDAARRFASAEGSALFEGHDEAGIPGLVTDAANRGVFAQDEDERFSSARVEKTRRAS